MKQRISKKLFTFILDCLLTIRNWEVSTIFRLIEPMVSSCFC